MIVSMKIQKNKKKKAKLSSEEIKKRKVDRQFKIRINTIFKNSGFSQIATRDKNITFKERMGEIDNIFIYENIIILVEDTCIKSENIRDHINKTSIFFSLIKENESDFVELLDNEFDDFKSKRSDKYDYFDFKFVYVYTSLNHINSDHKKPHGYIKFISNTDLRYFEALSKTISMSTKYEIFKYLGLKFSDIGFNHGDNIRKYTGFVLPEAPSGFPSEYKIVTFYIDPSTLIELSYVLRKDSWLDNDGLYQRMLIKGKIKSMREFLAVENRVFINNAIVSLPSETKYIDDNGDTIDPKTIKKTTKVNVNLPLNFNSIGLIDGQHRVYCYHQGNDKHEDMIAAKRKKQQLLVTGIVFPKNTPETERFKFEAKLFLEINDKQSRAKGDLKQSIQTIVDPYSSIALAKSVISVMAKKGPLEGKLEEHYFGDGVIKTTSIVSYGLKHIVAVDEKSIDHSLYKLWDHDDKGNLVSSGSDALKKEYISFCSKELNNFIAGFSVEMKKRRLWTTSNKQSKALTITSLNGLIFCFKKLIITGGLMNASEYIDRFNNLKIDFSSSDFQYRSSHWRALGDKIYDECFSSIHK